MNDLQLIELVAETDAYASQTPLPASTWSRDTALHEIKRRTGMDTRDTRKKETPPGVTQQIEPSAKQGTLERLTKESGKRKWSGALVGAVALAVVVIVVGAVILLASLGSDELGPAAPSPTTQAPPTTTPATIPPFTVDEALAVNDAYFAAYTAGDVDAMLALFTPDVALSGEFGSISVEAWERLYVWKVAEGTVLTARDCTTTASESAREVTVRCQYGHHEYLSRAVDGDVVPHTMTMLVTPDGVKQLSDPFGSPNFNVVGAPFISWMQENHPEDASKVGCCGWDSVEEARQNGLLGVQYADEWAAYLDANDCTYTEGC